MEDARKVLFLLFGVIFGLASASCPEHFVAVKSYCFQIGTQKDDFNEAWKNCALSGGYLAEVAEGDKMTVIQEHLGTLDEDNFFWIGGTSGMIWNDWRWIINGVKISNTNTNWCSGFPTSINDKNLATTMVLYHNVRGSYCWQNIDPKSKVLESKPLGYICEATATSE